MIKKLPIAYNLNPLERTIYNIIIDFFIRKSTDVVVKSLIFYVRNTYFNCIYAMRGYGDVDVVVYQETKKVIGIMVFNGIIFTKRAMYTEFRADDRLYSGEELLRTPAVVYKPALSSMNKSVNQFNELVNLEKNYYKIARFLIFKVISASGKNRYKRGGFYRMPTAMIKRTVTKHNRLIRLDYAKLLIDAGIVSKYRVNAKRTSTVGYDMVVSKDKKYYNGLKILASYKYINTILKKEGINNKKLYGLNIDDYRYGD